MANEDDMEKSGPIELRLKRVESKVDRVEQMLEKVGDDIKKLGEGYDDGMRRISDEIKDLNRQWKSKWSPHDLAIRNHGKRISALEQRRSRRS
jgi:hypothetical protein